MTKKKRTIAANRKHTKKKIRAKERAAHALQLRKAGHSYDRIAKEVGYRSRGAAYKAVVRGLRDMLQEPADEVRALELSRLDQLIAARWVGALKGSNQALDRILRCMEMRAKILGLYDYTPSVIFQQQNMTIGGGVGAPIAPVTESNRHSLCGAPQALSEYMRALSGAREVPAKVIETNNGNGAGTRHASS